ncbi:ABC transporter ATP-binding protein [Reticulibacter mediterranei]|uniref:ABC transporter ATP-binding protein n=1 Tax=Reticulibacter mediterranei TaxID=2778369 RepID=A0A8J3IWS7_9CHLR|nr:ATP-binding cassette domain-containing protein [Reticulibacter mediterranei]GHO97486.1 ABC transporter ATP-binding protein [Reticulibacter mediterranei]
MEKHIIRVEHLSRDYKTFKRFPGARGLLHSFFSKEYDIRHAVDDVSFSIKRGELVGYIGPNGAGKSTTFKMLTGVLVPTSGSIKVDELNPFRYRQQLARRTGIVFGQRSQLWWDLPLRDSMEILRAIYQIPKEIYKRNIAEYMQILEIDKLLNIPVRQLSLGQRMRGELIAAFLHNPTIAFLDEPLLGLDIIAKECVRQFISESNRKLGTTIILSSNDMVDVERLCQRILIIDGGKLLYDGTIEEIKRRFAPHRRLTVHMAEGYSDIWASEAKIEQQEATRITFRFERTVNPQQIIIDLSKRYVINDLIIEEPPLEEVIRELYERKN